MASQGQSALKYQRVKPRKANCFPTLCGLPGMTRCELGVTKCSLRNRQTWACVQSSRLRRGKRYFWPSVCIRDMVEKAQGVCRGQKQCIHSVLSRIWPIAAFFKVVYFLCPLSWCYWHDEKWKFALTLLNSPSPWSIPQMTSNNLLPASIELETVVRDFRIYL